MPADDEWWRGRRVWLGLDLSETDDNTSVAMVTDDGGSLHARVWAFCPAEKVELKSDREGVDYRERIRAGDCFACGDQIIDYGAVEAFVLALGERYGVEIAALGYDRYNAISSVQKFEAAPDPIECVEIRQHSSVLHQPTKLLYEQIEEGTFRYDANRLLEINFENARCAFDTNMNRYVTKKKSCGKVDMVVALINATRLCMDEMLSGAAWGAQIG